MTGSFSGKFFCVHNVDCFLSKARIINNCRLDYMRTNHVSSGEFHVQQSGEFHTQQSGEEFSIFTTSVQVSRFSFAVEI